MRIFILGASGTGTSTLGAGIARYLNVVHIESDQIYWEDTDPPFTTPRTADAIHDLFFHSIRHESFVLSGDVLNWGLSEQDLFNAFNHSIFIYVPWIEREKRIRKREQLRFGTRILPGGDMHESHEGFIAWASHYDSGLMPGRNKKSQLDFLTEFKKNGGRVLEIDGLNSQKIILNESISFITNPI